MSAAAGLSHAEITRAINDCIKDAVMADEETVAPEVLIELLAQRQQVRQRTPSANQP